MGLGKNKTKQNHMYLKQNKTRTNEQNNKSQLRFPVRDFTSRVGGSEAGADGVTAAPKRNYPEPAWHGARSPGPAPGPAAAAVPPFPGRHLAGQAATFPSAGAERCPAVPAAPRKGRRAFPVRGAAAEFLQLVRGCRRESRGCGEVGGGPQPSGREPEPLC